MYNNCRTVFVGNADLFLYIFFVTDLHYVCVCVCGYSLNILQFHSRNLSRVFFFFVFDQLTLRIDKVEESIAKDRIDVYIDAGEKEGLMGLLAERRTYYH